MKKIFLLVFIAACFCTSPACSHDAVWETPLAEYDSIPVVTAVVPIINEASGIADSKRNPGMLWVEEDSGNPPQLHLLGHNGKVVKQVFIKEAVNRDWEDMCLLDGKIYIGDIGDNSQVYDEYTIYRFDEPSASADTVTTIEKIRFNYADGPRDAEAFFVDPWTKDIFIITKKDNPSRIYTLSYPYSTTVINKAVQVASLSYSGIVSAAISPDGKELIIKTYIGLQHFKREINRPITDFFKNNFTALAYKPEPQGEAVGFAVTGNGFFTLSEKGFASVVNLYFYPKQ